MSPEVIDLEQHGEFVARAAEIIRGAALDAAAGRGRFAWALAGGSTPLDVYARLAEPGPSPPFPWRQTLLFWGDERFVPHDDPRSNCGAARKALIDRVDVPEANIHCIRTDLPTPEEAAAEYEDTLRSVLGPRPVLDLVLLGMGPDGHTASLFPGSPALEERRRWVRAVPPPVMDPQVPRITLTFPILERAGTILVLITGPSKRGILSEIMSGKMDAIQRYPVARLRPRHRMVWLCCRE